MIESLPHTNIIENFGPGEDGSLGDTRLAIWSSWIKVQNFYISSKVLKLPNIRNMEILRLFQMD